MSARTARWNRYAVLTVSFTLFVFLAPLLVENPILAHLSKDFVVSSHAAMSDQSKASVAFAVINWASSVVAFVFSLKYWNTTRPSAAEEGIGKTLRKPKSRALSLTLLIITTVLSVYLTFRLLFVVFFLLAFNH